MREPAIYPRMEEWLAYLNRNNNPNAMWGQFHKGFDAEVQPAKIRASINEAVRRDRKRASYDKWANSLIRKLERSHAESQGAEVGEEEQTA